MAKTVTEHLFDIDDELQNIGIAPLNAEQLRVVHAQFQKYPELMNQFNSGQLTPRQIAMEVKAATESKRARSSLPPASPPASVFGEDETPLPTDVAPYAEGGPINDASGRVTQQMRKQGYRLPPASNRGLY